MLYLICSQKFLEFYLLRTAYINERLLNQSFHFMQQMDKASVLGETIKQVRELKKRVKEMKAVCHGSLERVLPGELD